MNQRVKKQKHVRTGREGVGVVGIPQGKQPKGEWVCALCGVKAPGAAVSG
jgi:hypothetical protein